MITLYSIYYYYARTLCLLHENEMNVSYTSNIENRNRSISITSIIYVTNQESTDSIQEVHVGDALFAFTFNGSSQDLFQLRSRSLD